MTRSPTALVLARQNGRPGDAPHLIGVACIVGAIVGGGVKLVQVELRAFDSLQRQILLGIFGVMLVGAGLVMGNSAPDGQGSSKLAAEVAASPTPSVTQPDVAKDNTPPISVAVPGPEQAAPAPAPVADTTHDEPAVDSIAPTVAAPRPAVAARLPSKVDIFWCETEDNGDGNREAGARVGAALQADGRVDRVRVRPLSMATNARPDYGIDRDIVRYDPGERPAAALLASLATSASDRSFAPAPALPGTPSVDYLSVFVCGAN